MTQLFLYTRSHFARPADQLRLCLLASRLCLIFTAIVLAVSPWTEYRYDWDGFLRGGQDLEFGLLTIALVLCLVLLLSLRGSQRLLTRLASLHAVSSGPPALPSSSRLVCRRCERIASPGCSSRTLPLQI